MAGASEPDTVSTKQQRIAELAKQSPEMGFTSLAHHINLRWLYEAYLSQKLHGHFGYYGITGNGSALQRFRDGVLIIWKKWLARRRRRAFLSWMVFRRLLHHYVLPPARVIHSVYRPVGEPLP